MKLFFSHHIFQQQGRSLLACLVLLLAVSGCWSSEPQDTKAEKERPADSSSASIDINRMIVFEEPGLPAVTHQSNAAQARQMKKNREKPRVAIIIDDMGYHGKIGDQLLNLDLPLSFSFLPMAPFALEQEEKAYQLGREIMVHLPMEASDPKWDPGPGALRTTASAAELTKITQQDLAAVPHATGANNHMGSKFTRNRQAMHTVLQVLKEHGFFFIDSMTTASSTGMDEATVMGIKTGRRHIFLDNVQDQNKICAQLDKLTALAGKQGEAIGIGHPHQATYDALAACGKKLLSRAELVPAHELVQ
jgi:polysaccharide deacetylase 2 family uncharacterized protein YibQ